MEDSEEPHTSEMLEEEPTEIFDDPDEDQVSEMDEAMFARYLQVQDQSFEEIQIPQTMVDEIQSIWNLLLGRLPSREAVGEAVYDSIMEEAPGIAQLFKSPRSVFALRFVNGLNSLVTEVASPGALKKQVETFGFQHLDHDVSIPRVDLVRDAILNVMDQELGAQFSSAARLSMTAMLNYAGGAFVFIRRELAGRIKIIQRSWRLAQRLMEDADAQGDASPKPPPTVTEAEEEPSPVMEATDACNKAVAEKLEPEDEAGSVKSRGQHNLQVPTTFDGMFLFNAAVMGFGESSWMKTVLEHMDAIATNVANTSRLQEECYVLSIHLSKFKDPVNLTEFKAVMLAALRSIVPDEWNMDHEVAWNWLWENVERIISSTIALPRTYEKAVRTFLFSQPEDKMMFLRAQTFKIFFMRCPSGQDFFKQSTSRLYFILDKNYEMTIEMFENPGKVVQDLSALGLRHVGYGVPVELFPPFVVSAVEAVAEVTDDETVRTAFSWSLTLISKILIRVILEGSTIVMKAINLNEEAALRKAIAVAPRQHRATQLLNISVGTQSFSPLFWAIESGSLNSAKAMIQDLLTIRADREVYYYGCEELFRRHPDIVKRLCTSAPTLLETLLDGFIWRSRRSVNGMRRVNYYIKYLIQDLDGNFSSALSCFVEHASPTIASHPCSALAADTIWFKFATTYFLLGKAYFLTTLIVFATSQAFLVRHNDQDVPEEVWVILACRLLLYMLVLPATLGTLMVKCFVDCGTRNLQRVCGVPIPASLNQFNGLLKTMLLWVLLLMCITEPLIWCATPDDPETIFRTSCEEVKEIKTIYSILSALGMLLFWALVLDFSVFSTRISAFLLVCGHVIAEVGLFLLAMCFLLLAFSTSISALNHHLVAFDGVPVWMRSLFQIVIGMFPVSNYYLFEEEPVVMAFLAVFIILVFIFLLNLLVAQLNQSYHVMFADMKGVARLRRFSVICSVMASAPKSRWTGFLWSLGFEKRCEFNEGDVGIAGGLQVLEPASAVAVTHDSIKRYGGSTAPTMPWPAEVEPNDIEKERFDRLEKLIIKSMKSHKKNGHGRHTSSALGSSIMGSSAMSEDSSQGSGNGSPNL